jgi:hypothetical protein
VRRERSADTDSSPGEVKLLAKPFEGAAAIGEELTQLLSGRSLRLLVLKGASRAIDTQSNRTAQSGNIDGHSNSTGHDAPTDINILKLSHHAEHALIHFAVPVC